MVLPLLKVWSGSLLICTRLDLHKPTIFTTPFFSWSTSLIASCWWRLPKILEFCRATTLSSVSSEISESHRTMKNTHGFLTLVKLSFMTWLRLFLFSRWTRVRSDTRLNPLLKLLTRWTQRTTIFVNTALPPRKCAFCRSLRSWSDKSTKAR